MNDNYNSYFYRIYTINNAIKNAHFYQLRNDMLDDDKKKVDKKNIKIFFRDIVLILMELSRYKRCYFDGPDTLFNDRI